MSVQRNIIANYVGQGYSIGISILMLPLYLNYLGTEAYGLVGFFTLLQSWMLLLDMGMSPTLGREVARLREDPSQLERLGVIVMTLERFFAVVACVVMFGMISSSHWIADQWLNIEQLPLDIVIQALNIMAVVVAVRWQSSIYKSAINGFEAQVWMNVFEVIINTLRFPLVFVVVVFYPGQIELFFWCQLGVSIIELIVIRFKVTQLLPKSIKQKNFNLAEIRPLLPFAYSRAYAGAIWVFLSQYDKLLLSGILTLENYGYFALVASVTGGIMMLSGPVGKALQPRLTALLEAGKTAEMIELYRMATRYVVIMVVPIVLVIALWPKQVIYAWSGNLDAAVWISSALPLFVLSSGLVTINAFQYYLQHAFGEIKYNVRYSTVLLFVSVPLITFAAYQYGVVGVAWVLFISRAITFIFWIPFIHRLLVPGLHRSWFVSDFFLTLLLPLVLFITLKYLSIHFGLESGLDRVTLLSQLAALTLGGYTLQFIWHKLRKPPSQFGYAD